MCCRCVLVPVRQCLHIVSCSSPSRLSFLLISTHCYRVLPRHLSLLPIPPLYQIFLSEQSTKDDGNSKTDGSCSSSCFPVLLLENTTLFTRWSYGLKPSYLHDDNETLQSPRRCFHSIDVDVCQNAQKGQYVYEKGGSANCFEQKWAYVPSNHHFPN